VKALLVLRDDIELAAKPFWLGSPTIFQVTEINGGCDG
jgi:hypothetical protein